MTEGYIIVHRPTMIQFQEQKATASPSRAVYMLATLLSLVYTAYIFVYALQAFVTTDTFVMVFVVIVLLFCVHSFVMHILGISSMCMAPAETPGTVNFLRVSYWIHLITASMLATLVFVIFFLETEQPLKTIYLIMFLTIAIGLILLALVWSMYVFYISHEELAIQCGNPRRHKHLTANSQYTS